MQGREDLPDWTEGRTDWTDRRRTKKEGVREISRSRLTKSDRLREELGALFEIGSEGQRRRGVG